MDTLPSLWQKHQEPGKGSQGKESRQALANSSQQIRRIIVMDPTIATIVLFELLLGLDAEDLSAADEADLETLEDCGF